MKLDRLQSVLDTAALATKHVAVIGAGASADFASHLVRCGGEKFTLLDFDRVDATNIARQGHFPSAIGQPKVLALAERLRQINPHVVVHALQADLTKLSDLEIEQYFGSADLLVFATDSFAAQAKGNEIALRLQKPALWLGLSQGAVAGEIFFWHPGLLPCFRCTLSARFAAFDKAQIAGQRIDVPSDGADIFSMSIVDGIGGHIALGLLTRGAENRFGRLIEQLGNRQYIQIQLDPLWTLNGRNVVREQMGVLADNDRFFAWCTAARRDPTGGLPPCPDCAQFRIAANVTLETNIVEV